MDLSHHIDAIRERSHEQAQRLAASIKPDRTLPAALPWVRAWGPHTGHGPLLDSQISPN